MRQVILRQHSLGGGVTRCPLVLNPGNHTSVYGIHGDDTVEQQSVELIPNNVEDALAAIHIEGPHVCLEALSENVFVQSVAVGFDGSLDGRMKLKASNLDGSRISCQLQPGASIWIGHLTFSAVPEEHADLPIISSPFTASRYNSYVEQTSQQRAVPDLDLLNTDLPSTPRSKTTGVIDTEPSTVMRLRQIEENDMLLESPALDTAKITKRVLAQKSPNPQRKARDMRRSSLFGPKTNDENLFDEYLSDGPVVSSPTKEVKGLSAPSHPTESLSQHKRLQLGIATESQDTQDSLKGSIRVNKPIVHVQTKQYGLEPLVRIKPSHESPQDSITSPISISKSRYIRHNSSVSPEGSSSRTRSKALEETLLHPTLDGLRVILGSSSAVSESATFRRFLKQNNVEIVKSVQECTTLIVGKGELKKTAKVLMAVQLGKQIVHDGWIAESAKAGSLLSMDSYRASDPDKETEWGINLEEAIKRGMEGSRPMEGVSIIFTPTAKKDVGHGFGELKELSSLAGASNFSTILPKTPMSETPSTLIIAASSQDPAHAKLPSDWRRFSRDIIGISILRGRLDMNNDEFVIQAPSSETPDPKRSTKRRRTGNS